MGICWLESDGGGMMSVGGWTPRSRSKANSLTLPSVGLPISRCLRGWRGRIRTIMTDEGLLDLLAESTVLR